MIICPTTVILLFCCILTFIRYAFYHIQGLIFKFLLINCKKIGINIDVSFHMTVNKNSVHHRGLIPFEIFKSMVNTEKN